MRIVLPTTGIGLSLLVALMGCQKEGLPWLGLDAGEGGTGGSSRSGGGAETGGAMSAEDAANNEGGSATGGAGGIGGESGAGGSPGTGGTGGALARLCGGLAGRLCGIGQFCELAAGTCSSAPDAAGLCVAKSLICSATFQPVCGCDGKTYANECKRQSAGISKKADGACSGTGTACPADPSAPGTWGTTCIKGMICEYGNDPRSSCNVRLTCVGDGTTSLTPPPLCSVLPAATCPATRAAASGQACTPSGAYCGYAGLNCNCTDCSTGPISFCSGSSTWHCDAPNADTACPPAMPQLGTACTSNGQSCTYACGANNGRLCQQGYWFQASGGTCPISMRRAKKEITYIGQEERQRFASEVLRFKLATYEYRDPALAGKRHLGFIIEDVPGSPAVERDGTMVDLYGYASMLVAAMQEQSGEIARLRAEVRALQRRRK